MIISQLNLRAKILGLIIGISLATIAAMILIVLTSIKPRLQIKLEKRGASIAHAISSQCINPILTRKYFQLDLLLREFVDAEKDVDYIYVMAPDGSVTAHSFGREFPSELKKITPRVTQDGQGIAKIVSANQEIIDISLPLLDGNLGRLHVGIDAAALNADVNEITGSMIFIAVLFSISSLMIMIFLERWVIKPIFRIKAVAVDAIGGNFDQRVEIDQQDEIGSLANEFNIMLDAVKETKTALVAEKELLKKSEKQLRDILEKSPISMALVSADGTIEYINKCAVATFGYLPEDIPHMNDWWQKAYPEIEYREQVKSQWLALVEQAVSGNGYIERREYNVSCKNGAQKTMLVFGVLIADKVFVLFEDITAQKAAEHKIQQFNTDLEKLVAERTTELLRSNSDLSSFCYAISHELRAPVARIKGLSQALQEELAENPADAEYCAGRIEVASNELQRVIDSVLQLSRLSQSPFVPTLLDLSQLVREIATSLASETADRQIEFRIADDVTASGDPALVRLCLENILRNAIKYSMHQPLTKIEFGKDVATGAFFIKDNGIGFDMAYAGNLFEPFVRLHKNEEFSGSGIGLATVQRIIERHGGRIWADSSPGNGATFYFTLAPSYGDRHDA